MKAVIMAGGFGTRLYSVTQGIPKPMAQLLGKPILQYQIENLKKSGIDDITIVIGYLGDQIEQYFQDGSRFGVKISYYKESEPLGTAGALFYLQNELTDPFFMINGDLIFDIDFIRFYRQYNGIATLFVHPNSHPYDSYLCVLDKNNKIVQWRTKNNGRNIVNAGIHLISPKAFKNLDGSYANLDKHIIPPIVSQGQAYAYRSSEYVKDAGTPDRFLQIEKDIKMGIVAMKNLQNKQKAIFLDRDGVINEHIGFLTRPDQLILKENAGKAIGKINESAYLCIVVTNQPVIARGECTIEQLDDIHQSLDFKIGYENAYIDHLYYCPHHPDKGYAGENVKYKKSCDCRKPSAGMLLQASQDYNIDLKKSWMIGDSVCDIEAGKKAGCTTIFIGNSTIADYQFSNLYDAVEMILQHKENSNYE